MAETLDLQIRNFEAGMRCALCYRSSLNFERVMGVVPPSYFGTENTITTAAPDARSGCESKAIATYVRPSIS